MALPTQGLHSQEPTDGPVRLVEVLPIDSVSCVGKHRLPPPHRAEDMGNLVPTGTNYHLSTLASCMAANIRCRLVSNGSLNKGTIATTCMGLAGPAPALSPSPAEPQPPSLPQAGSALKQTLLQEEQELPTVAWAATAAIGIQIWQQFH